MTAVRWLKRKDGEMVLQRLIFRQEIGNGGLIQNAGYVWEDVPIEEEV